MISQIEKLVSSSPLFLTNPLIFLIFWNIKHCAPPFMTHIAIITINLNKETQQCRSLQYWTNTSLTKWKIWVVVETITFVRSIFWWFIGQIWTIIILVTVMDRYKVFMSQHTNFNISNLHQWVMWVQFVWTWQKCYKLTKIKYLSC